MFRTLFCELQDSVVFLPLKLVLMDMPVLFVDFYWFALKLSAGICKAFIIIYVCANLNKKWIIKWRDIYKTYQIYQNIYKR